MAFSQTLRFQVKQPMYLGDQFDDNANRKEIKVLKGQLIEGKELGNLVTRDWYGRKGVSGFEYKIPTLMIGKNRPASGMDVFFIPTENLTQIADMVYDSWMNPIEIDTKAIPPAQGKGKYKFNNDTDVSVTTEFYSSGAPLKAIIYNFKGGDVIDVKESLFNSATNEWIAKIPNITEQTQTIPFSRFTKVDDKTPITTTISKTEKTYSDNQLGTVGSNTQTSGSNTQTSGSNNQTIQSNSQIKESRNNKNIIIGIFVVSAIFVFLKLKEE
jgi:hypothetical protein